jgi:hypothetical protein
MDTISIGPSGVATPERISMDSKWNITISGRNPSELSLVCVFPWGEDAMYLFGSLDHSQTPVEGLPRHVSELLIFSPLVALRRLPLGFQGLTSMEWEDLVVTEIKDQPTCISAPTRGGVEQKGEEDANQSADNTSDESVEMSDDGEVPIQDDDQAMDAADVQSENESPSESE